MKLFELTRLSLEPLLPPLQKKARKRLTKIAKAYRCRPEILDVGGRNSPYTIGVPANITISDLPRATEVQQKLGLGINEQTIQLTNHRRSNVLRIVFDDMTRSALPTASFECVAAVEVLEHVEEDAAFVREVHRVLKPGGIFFMTTPNGDYVENRNPDHKRHYTKAQLFSLLSSVFDQAHVEYAIRGGLCRRLGLKSWSVKRPLQTGLSMLGNLVNSIQSAHPGVKHKTSGTHHLIAVAEKFN